MRRRNVLSALAVATALVFAGVAHAATWVIDNNHSTVGFKVRHMFTKVPGQFNKFAVTIEYDPSTPEA
jgi:polyisoprenoid-binding protein YceI